jgi:hypothetical protein
VLAERAYALALRLFPWDFRVHLAESMLTTFTESACELRRTPTTSAVRSLTAEFATLAWAIAVEWVAKLTTDASTRGRSLPDCRMMRPAGVTRKEWIAGAESMGHRRVL